MRSCTRALAPVPVPGRCRVYAVDHDSRSGAQSSPLRLKLADGVLWCTQGPWCCRAVEPRLKDVQQRTLLLTSDQDLLLPSRQEGPRLKRKLRRCELRVRC